MAIFFLCLLFLQGHQSDWIKGASYLSITLTNYICSPRQTLSIFLLCHLPVLPVGGGSPRWIAFGRPDQDADRKALLTVLAKHNVIVLCGHFHRFALSEYVSEEGRITQLMLNSVMDRTSWQTPEAFVMNKEFPFFAQSDFERSRKPDELRAFLAEYAAGLRESRQFAAYGYVILHVTQDAVSADLYSRTDDKPFAVWKLR